MTFNLNVRRSQTNAVGFQGRHPLVGNTLAMSTLKAASLVIVIVGLLFSREQAEIQAVGVRTSDAGTDIVYKLGQYPVISEYGFTAEAGKWSHFPSGFSFTQGNDWEVVSVLVLQPVGILCAFKQYVETPITLHVENSMVVKTTCDGTDAELVRSCIDSFHDPRAYAISHIGWGLNEKARWYQFLVTRQLSSEHVMNALAFYGNVLFSLGPNLELGGTNDTACHLDLPMRRCSLWLDDLQILDKGDVVHPAMRVGSDSV